VLVEQLNGIVVDVSVSSGVVFDGGEEGSVGFKVIGDGALKRQVQPDAVVLGAADFPASGALPPRRSYAISESDLAEHRTVGVIPGQ
jgi:hypothetical protein